MRAILLEQPGGADQLYLGEAETPKPAPDEILIKVAATALNRADIMQREGKYPPPEGASPILGLEVSGEVAECGKSVSRWKEGDKVFGLLPGGGYAEYAIMHEAMAMAVPPNLSLAEAAAIPEVFLTAFQALRWLSGLKAGERVLIHAGGSGVGTAAIQLACEMSASDIIITASAAKHATCLSLGATHAIDYKSKDFEEEVKKISSGGVDVVIDFIAAPYFEKNINCLRKDGRLVLLALLGGVKVREFNLLKLLSKRLQISASTLRSRSRDYQQELTGEFAGFAWQRLADSRLKPVIDSVMSWKQVREAHQRMESNQNTGKIVMEVNT
jgi:putative PIG3 family NAD(P)H quinone oxidoreductase